MLFPDAEGGELCVGLCLVGIVLWFGDAITRTNVRARHVGLCIAATATILFLAQQISRRPLSVSADAVVLVIRALAFGAFATGVGWCAAPPMVGLYEATIVPFLRWRRECLRLRSERRRSAEEAKRARLEELRRKQEWERGAPQRQRQTAEAARKAVQDAGDHKRREDARANCLLYFNRFERDLRKYFSRSLFDSFIEKHMSDRQSPDDVEEKGRQLQQMIDDVLAVVLPGKHRRPQSIEEISRWYLTQREQVEALALDEDLRETHLANLDARYMELTQSALERAQP